MRADEEQKALPVCPPVPHAAQPTVSRGRRDEEGVDGGWWRWRRGGGGGGGRALTHWQRCCQPAWSAQPRGLILTQNPLGTKSQVMLR